MPTGLLVRFFNECCDKTRTMSSDRNKDLIKRCNMALETSRNLVDVELYEEIAAYVNRYNECHLGMGMLIEHICEEQLRLDQGQYEKIMSAMQSMELGSCYYIEALKCHMNHSNHHMASP